MNINWTVRLKNKNFWLTLIPAVMLLIQAVLTPFGYQWDYGVLGQELAAIVNAAFGVLALLGVVNDPTTCNFCDSERALNYDKPA